MAADDHPGVSKHPIYLQADDATPDGPDYLQADDAAASDAATYHPAYLEADDLHPKYLQADSLKTNKAAFHPTYLQADDVRSSAGEFHPTYLQADDVRSSAGKFHPTYLQADDLKHVTYLTPDADLVAKARHVQQARRTPQDGSYMEVADDYVDPDVLADANGDTARRPIRDEYVDGDTLYVAGGDDYVDGDTLYPASRENNVVEMYVDDSQLRDLNDMYVDDEAVAASMAHHAPRARQADANDDYVDSPPRRVNGGRAPRANDEYADDELLRARANDAYADDRPLQRLAHRERGEPPLPGQMRLRASEVDYVDTDLIQLAEHSV